VAQFTQDPSAHYGDYYERALYNDILSSQDPDSGMMTYFAPMKPGHFKVYSDPTNAFWCCVGTGIENHARYGEAIYFHDADDRSLSVNLFISSVLSWRAKGLTLTQQTRFPEAETTHLTMACANPTRIALKLRRPSWADDITVSVNGKSIPVSAGPGTYITIDRTWHSGDSIDVRLPMTVRLEPLPNSPGKQAVMYGPLLLVGVMGRYGLDKLSDIQDNQAPYDNLPALDAAVFVTPGGEAAKRIKSVPGQTLTFHTDGLAQPADVTLIPNYRMHHQRFNTYWNVFTPDGWEQHKAELTAATARLRALDVRTVDRFLPGNQQSEIDHHVVGRQSDRGDFNGRSWRDASNGGSFSFSLKVDSAANSELQCTYWGSDTGGRSFDISIESTTIGSQTLDNNRPGQFFDVAYPIPVALLTGKSSVTVTFQARPGQRAGGLFDCRMLRRAPDRTALSLD
jgi:hypothetical protein